MLSTSTQMATRIAFGPVAPGGVVLVARGKSSLSIAGAAFLFGVTSIVAPTRGKTGRMEV